MMLDPKEATSLLLHCVVVKRRKLTIIVSVIAVFFLYFMITPDRPRLYEAKATLLVDKPEVSSYAMKGIASSIPGTMMKKDGNFIWSKSLAEEAVRMLRVGLGDSSKVYGARDAWLMSDTAAIEIQKSVSVTELKDTNVIEIAAVADSPQKAIDIANAVTKVAAIKGPSGNLGGEQVTMDYVDGQLEIFKEKMAASREALVQYKAEHGFGEAPSGLSKIDHVETEYINTKMNLQIAETKMNVLRKEVYGQQKEIVPSISHTQNPLITKLRETLIELELKRSLLLREYTEKHPEVQELDVEISNTVSILKEEAGKEVGADKIILDPWDVYQKSVKSILDLEVEINSLKIREASLLKLLNEYSATITADTRRDAEMLKLMQEVSTDKKTYAFLLEKKEKLRVNEVLNGAKTGVFDLAGSARAPLFQQRESELLICLIMGILLGLAIAFTQESMDTSFKTIEDVERFVGKRVIGAIPKIDGRKKDVPKVQKKSPIFRKRAA